MERISRNREKLGDILMMANTLRDERVLSARGKEEEEEEKDKYNCTNFVNIKKVETFSDLTDNFYINYTYDFV